MRTKALKAFPQYFWLVDMAFLSASGSLSCTNYSQSGWLRGPAVSVSFVQYAQNHMLKCSHYYLFPKNLSSGHVMVHHTTDVSPTTSTQKALFKSKLNFRSLSRIGNNIFMKRKAFHYSASWSANTVITSNAVDKLSSLSSSQDLVVHNDGEPDASLDGDDNNDDDEDEIDLDEFVITPDMKTMRIDKILATRYADQSRNYIQSLIEAGAVLANDQKVLKNSAKYKPGTLIQVSFDSVPLPYTSLSWERLEPCDIPLDILYEDDHMIAINKPPGLVVHPAPGNWTGTIVNALLHAYPSLLASFVEMKNNEYRTSEQESDEEHDGRTVALDDDESYDGAIVVKKKKNTPAPRPGIVHRLDKGTSGVIIVAKNYPAHQALVSQFAARTVVKYYLAVCCGGNPTGKGSHSVVVDAPIGRNPVLRKQMKAFEPPSFSRGRSSTVYSHVVDRSGGPKPARTVLYLVKESVDKKLSLVLAKLETGRTHQIRVHLKHRKAPVLGDDVYGLSEYNKRYKNMATRPMLHAWSISVYSPKEENKEDNDGHTVDTEAEDEHQGVRHNVFVKAPLDQDMRKLIQTQIWPEFSEEALVNLIRERVADPQLREGLNNV